MPANLYGQVTGILSIPVKGAKVEIDEGQHRSTITDEDGWFIFEGIELGNWVMGVTAPSYQLAGKTIPILESKSYIVNVSMNLRTVPKILLILGILLPIGALGGAGYFLSRRK